MTPVPAAVRAGPAAERVAAIAERVLRHAGDARVGLALLLAVGTANVAAAVAPDGPQLLEGWPYAVLLGALALSAVASVAVRAPVAWREWRRPGPVAAGSPATILAERSADEVRTVLANSGYRVRVERRRGAWAVHGVRRGWSRFAGVLSHLAIVVVALGAALGAAFGSETTFSLLPGEQALLDAPRPGFASAVRLEALDADFDADGRPVRLDTTVTHLRDGDEVERVLVRANEPADLDGYLVHPWTYGPAARIRVSTLGGAVLLDDAVPLDRDRDGVPVGAVELPTAGVSVGLALIDSETATLGISGVTSGGLVGTARLVPGEAARVGNVVVELASFDAWVTFLSRRDPGLAIVFAGAAGLSATLAIAFWLPRRRVTVRPRPDGHLRLVVRGERFDRPEDEVARLRDRFALPTAATNPSSGGPGP